MSVIFAVNRSEMNCENNIIEEVNANGTLTSGYADLRESKPFGVKFLIISVAVVTACRLYSCFSACPMSIAWQHDTVVYTRARCYVSVSRQISRLRTWGGE